ncbi:MAG: hypothetical protein LBN99_06925, partial [Oscillospiraceae bacterium]|nr:hypothetical protein [Oscillospiraceae bacterium]
MNPQDEEFTLESILAEYKGISYIDGDKKTPKDVLDETARRIVQEETPPSADTRRTAAPIEEPAAFTEEFEEPEEPDEPEEPEEPEYPEIYVEEPEPVVAEESEPDADEIETYSSDDGDLDFFDSYRYSSPDPEEDIVRSVTEAIEREESEERERQKPGLFRPREERTVPRRREREEQEWQAITAPEPDYRDLARRYAARCNSLSTKAVAALVLSLIIALLTFLFEAGKALPLGLGRNAAVTGGVLLLLQLFVMLLGVETLVRGARDLATGGASADTLVFVSCIVTVFSGMYGMRSGGALLPYSAASALSLTFSLWGERMRMEALADTLRSASSAEDPHSVVSEYRHDLERTVLKKTMGRYHGFYSNLTQPDVSETAYSYAVPLILAFLVIITLYSALAHKDMSRIPGMFAALSAAAAAFTATLAFALPFRSAAKRAKLSGASIAGAGGADDIFYTDGCCITDEDLYPQDSLSVGDPQILKQVPKEKAIRYTASLIIASASCLAKVFSTILINEGMSLITTQDFVVSEGGVSGMIRGERVLTGNYAFMNLYSIRVPDELKLGNSVYTAVNGTL